MWKGHNSMQLGSTVTLAYTGKLDDGTVFGYANEEKPMVFQTGMDQAIDGFEKKILELENVGDKAEFTLGMYEAYGEYQDDFTTTLPREALPTSVKLGKRMWMWGEDGDKFPATVVDIDDQTGNVTMDLNHPLAGKDLHYEVEILGIEVAPKNFVPEELRRKEQERLAGMLQGDFN